jgi:hypothetical protein
VQVVRSKGRRRATGMGVLLAPDAEAKSAGAGPETAVN